MILNLTQHVASTAQVAEGVVEPSNKSLVQELLTFSTLPSGAEMNDKAQALADIADEHEAHTVMLGGAPYFMPVLELVLNRRGINVVYAFSVRESIEVDGVKTSVFKHVGWVTA